MDKYEVAKKLADDCGSPYPTVHAEQIANAMEKYAEQQAVAFAKDYNKGKDDRFDVRYKYFLKDQNKTQ